MTSAPPLVLGDLPPGIRAALPDELSLEVTVHGRSATVVFVAGGERPLVLKRAAEPPYAGWVQVEAEVLHELAGTGLPVPEVIACEQGPGGQTWLLLDRLPGEPLVDRLQRIAPEDRPPWFARLGRLLGRVHTTVVPDALLARDSTPWWQRPRPHPTGTSGREALSATQLDHERVPPAVFVHGDFTLDNVLALDDELSGIVDWGGAGRGDPRYDVALALLSAAEGEDRLPAKECVSAFRAGYLEAVADDEELFAYFSHVTT